MKNTLRTICVILIVSLLLAIPAGAESTTETRGSAFFAAYSVALEKTSSTSFRIWFEVDANLATMDVLGVSEITVYRSKDQQNWTTIRTYTMGVYPEMVDQNTSSHGGYVTHQYARAGYYYRAYVTFYAQNSTGIGERYVYTGILSM